MLFDEKASLDGRAWHASIAHIKEGGSLAPAFSLLDLERYLKHDRRTERQGGHS